MLEADWCTLSRVRKYGSLIHQYSDLLRVVVIVIFIRKIVSTEYVIYIKLVTELVHTITLGLMLIPNYHTVQLAAQ